LAYGDVSGFERYVRSTADLVLKWLCDYVFVVQRARGRGGPN
jgi:hypothetical protein